MNGLEWDPDVEAWFVKDIPDGRRVWVIQMAFTAAVIVGEVDSWTYDDRWCYATLRQAAEYARAWDGAAGTEPVGWHRHPASGRRRPHGDPAREYLMA